MLMVGIDEAGYGPLLGPLVVSAAAMKLPDELAGLSLWQLLSDGLTDQPKKAKGRLIIADSKKLFHGKSRDLRELERSCLGAILLGTGQLPSCLDELVKSISLEPDPHLVHPWYAHQPLDLPCRVQLDSLHLSTRLLERELSSISAKFIGVKTVPLVEKRYNFLVEKTKNKSEILFSQSARLIHELVTQTDERHIRILADKQGGKDSYTRSLLRYFPDSQLKVLTEEREESAYQFVLEGRTVDIHFCMKGEQKHLLIAWASIVSKFLRELFMIQFNSYWSKINPELLPTAGYWQDGQRFIKDIDPILQRMNIPPTDLIRRL